jgi:hypothetical protein
VETMNRGLRRPSTAAVTRALLLLVSYLPALHSRPTFGNSPLLHVFDNDDDDDGGFPAEDPSSPAFWWKLGISVILVLLGGLFAGASSRLAGCVLIARTDIGASQSGRDHSKLAPVFTYIIQPAATIL